MFRSRLFTRSLIALAVIAGYVAGGYAWKPEALADQPVLPPATAPSATQASPKRIVYVCAATDSMQSIFATTQTELKRAVDAMDEKDAFNVLFFGGPEVASADKTAMLLATADNKQLAKALITDTRPAGTSGPVEAMKAAVAQSPAAVLLIVDAFVTVEDLNAVAALLRDENKEKKIKVDVTLIRNNAINNPDEALKTIVTENGGEKLRIVSQDDL